MFITKDKAHLVLPSRPELVHLIPHARPFAHAGQNYLLVPNKPDETKLVRNLGFDVPPPIVTQYDWCGQTPWDVQRTTSALLVENPRFFVLSSMGTGKTRAAIWAADWLMRTGVAHRALITAPLSTLTPVWQRELFQVMPREPTVVLHHTQRLKRLEALKQNARWFIINHHGVGLMRDELVAKRFDIIIIDELAVFRNQRTDLWKTLNVLIRAGDPPPAYVWGMTGSPTPRAPTDAYAQVRLIAPLRVPKSFMFFRDQTMRQVSPFKWLNRPEATAVVHRAMQPSVRFSRDDIEELPETSYIDRDVPSSPAMRQMYAALMDRMRAMIADGTITAANEGILQGKLLQVSCGYVYTDTKGVHNLPNTNRLRALEEAVAETERGVLVFVPFLHALQGVADHLRRAGEDIAVVHGGTSRAQRDTIFTSFQAGMSPRVIVAHPQTMAHGLTLTRADTIIWFSPTMSLETYEQANARITRPGQKFKTVILHLVGTHVEKITYTRLRNRSRMQGALLSMFHDQDVSM